MDSSFLLILGSVQIACLFAIYLFYTLGGKETEASITFVGFTLYTIIMLGFVEVIECLSQLS